MAFCMWRIHSGVGKPACKLILPNCNLSRIVLRDACKISDSLCWASYSALLSRSVPGHNDKTSNGSGQLNSPILGSPKGWSANNNQLSIKDPISLGKLSVNLCQLYSCDPLAILLHSRLQVYNINYPDKHEEETNKTKGPKRLSQLVEQSVQHPNITSCWLRLHHDALSDQQNTSPLSAASYCEGSVRALFPSYQKAIVTSCVIDSVVSPPSPSHTVLESSALYQDRAFAKSSLHQCVPPVHQPGTNHSRGPAAGGGGGKVDPGGLPTPEQLRKVHDILIESLSNVFVRSGNYRIYDPNIIFENRIRGTVTNGLSTYALQMSLMVIIGHLKHAHIRFDIIKITQHPEEGTIKVRWRIKGLKTRQAFLGFFKARKWNVSSVIEQTDSTNWYDGFSTFYVNSAGLVFRHVADNMMPDDEKLSTRQKTGFLGRLAVFGLLPKAGHGNAMMGVQPSNI